MREIKFRGKTQEGNWVQGDLTTFQYPDNVKPVLCWIWVQSEDFKTISKVQVDHNTIGQFTGLKDKNGVEIYEGDELQYTDVDGETYNGEIVYRNAAFDILGNWNEWLGEGYADECLVIGKIHDK
jgi:uncharacterized phage protein (TIGR01671 family)